MWPAVRPLVLMRPPPALTQAAPACQAHWVILEQPVDPTFQPIPLFLLTAAHLRVAQDALLILQQKSVT